MTDDNTTTDDEDEQQYEQGRQDAMSAGAKIRGKLKRGNDTRDQDELVIEARSGSTDEAIEDFEEVLTAAEERGWDERLRNLQPDGGDD